ncbi:DUF6994 family protein [Bombilactobacillus bombi]|uniref:DUF6994 family protein n=1 Tax=Bombilactobacillus bombi TaxID=1303590 RepID=UPI0015E5BE73|nr:hypothetical protein [Bombilactobacillus bombi]MBA1434971.1 hypothetical protein [Bombilactobacillus bombi]
MQVYQTNIQRLKTFYTSDYYYWLKDNDPKLIDRVRESLYDDPDSCDLILYKKLALKYKLAQKRYNLFDEVNDYRIKMSADVVCGSKQLMKLHPNFEVWIKDYENIRANLDLHFIWPQHKLPTINTYRYTIYHDRIDYLLYDLKCYFEGENTPMMKAYCNDRTSLWLSKFNNNFCDFVNEMCFSNFVNKNYEVLNIEYGQSRIIDGNLEDLRSNSHNEISMQDYLEQILALSISH